VTRANQGPRQAGPTPVGGGRLPFDVAAALSAAGLVVIAAVSFALLGGTLPALPGDGNGGPNGPVRTPTASNVVITDPRSDVPGRILYAKGGSIWVQSGADARQLTDSGGEGTKDSMPAWSPDGQSIYFVRTTRERGTWPSGAELREYNLHVPRLLRIAADGTGEPEVQLTGNVRSGSNRWSYFIREPSISPDGSTAAIVTDGPDPTQSDIVLKLLDLETGELTDPGVAQTQSLGHQAPAWSPDGRFVLYVRNAREGTRGTPSIFRYNVANERSQALTSSGYSTPSWSRDGRFVAATRTSNFGTDVVILDARTGVELLRVTNDDSSFSPVWSPEGDAIAYLRVQHGVVDLYLVRLSGTAPDWTVGEPIALTVAAGLDAEARPVWFIPESELPPLPTPTPVITPGPDGSGPPASPVP
jgi:Tol biopolymer transport system component